MIKQPTQPAERVELAVRSSVCLVRTPLLLLTPGRVGISQIEQKIIKQNREERRKYKIQIYSNTVRKRGLRHLRHSASVYMSLLRELWENPKLLPKIQTHLSVRNLVSAGPSPSLTLCCLLTARDPSLLGLSPQITDLWLLVLNLIDQRP